MNAMARGLNSVVADTASSAQHPATRPAGSRDRWLLMRLFAAVQSLPRLADRLMDERGSLGAVLSLSDERLRQLGADANGVAILGLLREAISAVVEPMLPECPRIESPSALVEMMFASMAWLAEEQVRAAFLDSGQRLIRTEILSTGTPECATVHPRQIVRRALELSASAVVLVHNHPSGDPTPSASDRAITERLAAALATVDITLLDHLVIARAGWASAAAPAGGISTLRISTTRNCRNDRSGLG